MVYIQIKLNVPNICMSALSEHGNHLKCSNCSKSPCTFSEIIVIENILNSLKHVCMCKNYRPLLFGDAFYGYLNVYILNGYCWSSNCNSLLFSWSSSYFGIINKIHYDAGVFYHHEPPTTETHERQWKKCAAQLKFLRMGKLNIWIKWNNFIIYRFHCTIKWSIHWFNNKHGVFLQHQKFHTKVISIYFYDNDLVSNIQ